MADEYSPPPVWEDTKAVGEPINLLIALSVMVRRWPFIVAMGAGGFLLALGIAFAVTPKFTSTAVFLPPTQRLSSTDNPFAALLKTPSTSVYIGLLLSNTVLGDVVKECKLQDIYHAKDIEQAQAALRRVTQVSTDTAGFVSLQVSDPDPNRAQLIAKTFLSALAKLDDSMASAEAAHERHIYEEALRHEKDALEDAEVDLKKAQESSGVIQPQSQLQAGLLAIDSVRAQIRAQQVRLIALQQAETDQAPEIVAIRSQIATLEGQLHRLESGGQGAAGEGLTASKAPSVNLTFIRLTREMQYHQTLFDVMAKQYESARLEESSAAPGVQIVDFPAVPLHKSWPRRSLFAAVGGLLGLITGLVVVFARERLAKLRQDPDKITLFNTLKEAAMNSTFRP